MLARALRPLRYAGMAVCLVVLGAACNPEPTPAATTTPVGTVSPGTAVATASPTVPPEATPEPTHYGAWFVDADTLDVTVLYDELEHRSISDFTDEGVWLNEARDGGRVIARHYSFEGELLEERDEWVVPTAEAQPQCAQQRHNDLQALIDGREYEANCGLFSPDSSTMLYSIDSAPTAANIPGGDYRAYVLDLRTGASARVDTALRHCGGCDSRAGPSWSPSGRYILVTETYGGEDSSVYLYDAELEVTTLVAQGPSIGNYLSSPSWAPEADAYLRPEGSGSAIEWLADGRTQPLEGVPWPAFWAQSPGGPLLVVGAPAFGEGETVVANAETGEELARWSGSPSLVIYFWFRLDERGVVTFEGEPAALLRTVPACNGLVLQHPLVEADGRCLEGAGTAAFSPDGALVAYSRNTDRDQPIGPTNPWEIVVLDLVNDDDRVVGEVTLTYDTPLVRWSPDGRTLLVAWPPPGI